MKKIISIIMVAISVIAIAYYVTSTFSYHKSLTKFTELSGEKSFLKDDKINMILKSKNGIMNDKHFIYNQCISSKGVITEESYDETAIYGITKENFEENKSLYRGINMVDFPMYEDDNYKVVVQSNRIFYDESSQELREIVIAYEDKSTGKIEKLNLQAPEFVHAMRTFHIEPEKDGIKYIYYGRKGEENYSTVLVVTHIDFKKGTIEKENVIDVTKYTGMKECYSLEPYVIEGKLYARGESVEEIEKDSTQCRLFAVDLENYTMKKIALNSEEIKNHVISKVGDNILATKVENGNIIIKKFDCHKQDFVEQFKYHLCDDDEKNIAANVLTIKENKIYLDVTVNGSLWQRYIYVLDMSTGKELYKCAVNPLTSNIIIE